MSHQEKMMVVNPVLSNAIGSTLSGGGIKQANSQMRMLESMDEKQILQYEIDQVKERVRVKEEDGRLEMDKLRELHSKAI